MTAHFFAASRRGYTLIEMLVVLALLGVLSMMVTPMAALQAQRAKEVELKRALWQIRDAIDAYHHAAVAGALGGASSQPGYPPSLEALTRLHPDTRAGRQGQVLRFLRSIPRDPFADDNVPAAQTWGLRSYASEAARPQPGADVYDVFSRATGTGLNGVPLGHW